MAVIWNNDGIAYTSGPTDNPASFTLLGGRYELAATATFGGGNIALQQLMPDGTTYAQVTAAYGTHPITAAGTAVFDLSPGTYRIVITTATAAALALTRVPYRAA